MKKAKKSQKKPKKSKENNESNSWNDVTTSFEYGQTLLNQSNEDYYNHYSTLYFCDKSINIIINYARPIVEWDNKYLNIPVLKLSFYHDAFEVFWHLKKSGAKLKNCKKKVKSLLTMTRCCVSCNYAKIVAHMVMGSDVSLKMNRSLTL